MRYGKGTPKLTNEDVMHIKALIHERELLIEKANELNFSKIAEKFGICKQMVSAIATGKVHKTIYASDL